MVYSSQARLLMEIRYFCLARVITMAMVIVVRSHMVVIGYLRVIISLFAEIAVAQNTEPLYSTCT